MKCVAVILSLLFCSVGWTSKRVFINRVGPSTQVRKAIEFEIQTEKSCGFAYDVRIKSVNVQNSRSGGAGQIWIETAVSDAGATRPDYCMKAWVSTYFTNNPGLRLSDERPSSLLKFLKPGEYRVYFNSYYHGSLVVPSPTAKTAINYVPFKGYRTRGLGFIIE